MPLPAAITHGIVSDVERRALALTGAGDMIWDWDVSADQGLHQPRNRSSCSASSAARWKARRRSWLDVLHPLDRDRFRAALDGVLEQRRGRLSAGFPPARRRTGIICGSRSRRGRWSARTAKWCGWSAR